MYTFIETRLFTRLVSDYMSDEELKKLQIKLSKDPKSGSLIPGSGGLRKIRWAGSGRGKRGGIRIIYYAKTSEQVIWLLTLYPKNVRENIPTSVLKKIKEEIENA